MNIIIICLVTTMSPATVAEPILMPFWLLDGGSKSTHVRKGASPGHAQACLSVDSTLQFNQYAPIFDSSGDNYIK